MHLVCLEGAVCSLGLYSVLPTPLKLTGRAALAAHSPVPAGRGSFKPSLPLSRRVKNPHKPIV